VPPRATPVLPSESPNPPRRSRHCLERDKTHPGTRAALRAIARPLLPNATALGTNSRAIAREVADFSGGRRSITAGGVRYQQKQYFRWSRHGPPEVAAALFFQHSGLSPPRTVRLLWISAFPFGRFFAYVPKPASRPPMRRIILPIGGTPFRTNGGPPPQWRSARPRPPPFFVQGAGHPPAPPNRHSLRRPVYYKRDALPDERSTVLFLQGGGP